MSRLGLVLFTAMAAGLFYLAGSASGQGQDSPTANYVITYIEAAPGTEQKVAALLKERAAEVRQNPDNLGYVALQRLAPKYHFAIVELWKTAAAFAAEASTEPTKHFRQALAPLLTAPYDERPHTALAADSDRTKAALTTAKSTEVFVVTHIDIIPTEQDEGIAATKALFPIASKDAGNVSYDVLQLNSRVNHMTLFEVWRDADDLARHATRDYMKSYRETLLPMSGSLYDQRTYTILH